LTSRGTGDPSADPGLEKAGDRARGGVDPLPRRAREGEPHACSCEVWGVLNVTPDSFSDGGAYLAVDAALVQAARLLRDGATVIDIGGESSRPSGKTYGEVAGVSETEELRRVLPVVEGLRAIGARISVDTVKAVVAERALRAGAAIINDVSCGRSEQLLRVAAASGAELVLMHNRGRGERSAVNVRYDDVVREVIGELMAAVDRALTAGVRAEQIWLDPGIGFAKTAAQSIQLLARTDALVATGHRVLVGASRKSFIAESAPLATGGAPSALQRVGGSAAALTMAVLLGAHGVRVHDVLEMRQAALLASQLREARP
jgi:dihydropteroate synthase